MKIKHIFISVVIFITSLFIVKLVVFAENSNSDAVNNLQQEISDLENKISQKQQEEQTLQREIDQFNYQIDLTQLKIQQSQEQITQKEKAIKELAGDIKDLKTRIDKLGESISYQEKVLGERLRERYKTREDSPFFVIFASDTVNELVKKTEYLKVMEQQDKKLLDQMNSTKTAFANQKNIFEDKKQEEEDLKKQLEAEKANLVSYNSDLERQNLEKKSLLERTQNDEAKFQEQLEEAKKELEQITKAVSVLKDTEPTHVDQGDIIGYQGSTGYSSGEHLHFGVYRYSSFEDISGWNWYYSNTVNPKEVLKKKNVYWNTGCESSGTRETGKGDWIWPIDNPTISQGFGYTCWSPIYYNGNEHPAYDMYGSYGTPVYAVEDGEAYSCRNCLGDGANGVFIFHDNDYMTVYWHLR